MHRRVVPTRHNLRRIEKRLALAHRGKHALEQKRDAIRNRHEELEREERVRIRFRFRKREAKRKSGGLADDSGGLADGSGDDSE